MNFDHNGNLVPYHAISVSLSNSAMRTNSKLKEITTTLQQIEKANKMIAYHKGFDEPDANAIENFEYLKRDFLRQLAELLKAFEVEVRVPMAA
ncbi:MAG: hypothetical protein IPN76_02920 [Saprospiraceae bacterium]|nr:hypothetical protein [Saprospiraceae bacterium]